MVLYIFITKSALGARFLIGITDVQEEGIWRYASNGDVMDFVDFVGSNNNDDEHCVVIRHQSTGSFWNDVPCSRQDRFICEF